MKISFSTIKNSCTRATYRTAFLAKKHSPEILTGVGIVGMVGTVVLGARATLQAGDILDELQQDVKNYNMVAENNPEKYSPEDLARAKTIRYGRASLKMVKLYAPTVTLGLASIGCILAAHGIMKKRNAALAAAYKGMEEAFNKYRARVEEAVGEEQERDIFNGVREEEVVDENGKKKVVKVTEGPASMYSFLFDETRPTWNKDRHINKMFIQCQQNIANDLLRTRGHLFLNEVLDMLGMERNAMGQQVGWMMDKGGDNCVDFGLDLWENPNAKAFLDGDEPGVWLNFNVDGNILADFDA